MTEANQLSERAAITVASLIHGNIHSLEKGLQKVSEKSSEPEVTLEVARRAIASMKVFKEAAEQEILSPNGLITYEMGKMAIEMMSDGKKLPDED